MSLFKHRNRVPAEATVVSCTFVSPHGIDRTRYDLVLDVAPTGVAPFRTTIRIDALSDQHPQIGDVVHVGYQASDGSVDIDLDDDPRYRTQDPAEAQAFNERCAQNQSEQQHLDETGETANAVLTEVTECGWMRALGQREFAVVADVSPKGRPPFEARFSIFDTTSQGLDTPTVGQRIAVVFDPTDVTMTRAAFLWDSPSLATFDGAFDDSSGGSAIGVAGPRWTVPTECPTCGAPVDQSTESFAEHPTCHMCKAPLPCEPAGK
jgi:hypothetical protein